MSDVFVGDNDHGDRVPSAEVLLQMIDKLRKERDHARRLYCEQARYSSFHASPRWTAEEVAQKFGWDCFEPKHKKAREALDRLVELDQELGLE